MENAFAFDRNTSGRALLRSERARSVQQHNSFSYRCFLRWCGITALEKEKDSGGVDDRG